MKRIMMLMMSLAVFGITGIQAQTQTFRIGVKGGVNLTEFTFKNDDFKADNRTGFFIGPIVHVNLPLVGLGLNIAGLYNQKESKVNGAETIKHKTFDVPLNLRYAINFTGNAGIFFEAGPQIAFTLGDRALKYHDNDLADVNWRFNDSDISANVGGGLTLGHLQLGVNYNLPLGKTGEFEWNGTTEHQLLHTSSKAKTWQVSAAWFF